MLHTSLLHTLLGLTASLLGLAANVIRAAALQTQTRRVNAGYTPEHDLFLSWSARHGVSGRLAAMLQQSLMPSYPGSTVTTVCNHATDMLISHQQPAVSHVAPGTEVEHLSLLTW
jgi:hypothetical protein